MRRTMPPTRLPRKKDVAVALLEQSSVYVHLDPRAERVSVPPWFKKQPQLVLQIGLNMAVPIPDLHLDDDGLSCTLSFSRSPHYCVVPWSSVYALVGEDGRGMVWPDDVPPEVAAQMQQKAAPKPKLAAVADGPQERPAPAAEKPASPAAKKAGSSKPALAKQASAKSEKDGRPSQPSEEKPQAKRKRSRKKAEPKALASVPEPAPEPKQEAASSSSSGKGKRELPPYLRVIK